MAEIGRRTRGEPVKTKTYPIRRQFRDFAIEGPPGIPPSFAEARDLLWRLRGAQFDQPIDQIYLFTEAELRLQQLEWIVKKLEADQKVRPYPVMWFRSPRADQ